MTILIYSQGGGGKTALTATILEVPELLPALYLDVDRSADSIRSKLHYLKGGAKDPEFGKEAPAGKMHAIRINRWEDFQDVYDSLFDHRVAKSRTYKTLIPDTLSEAHQYGLLWSASKDPDPKRLDKTMPQIQDYGGAHNVLRKMMKALRDLDDLNLVYTAQPRTISSEAEGIQEIIPWFVGSFAEDGLSLIPNVGILKVVNGEKRVLHLGNHQKHYGKYRVEGGLAAREREIPDPTMRKIYDTLVKE